MVPGFSLVLVWLMAAAAAGAGAAPGRAAQAPVEPSPGVPTAVTERVTASVGLVRSAGGNGSGWVAAPGTVVTNEHVARAGSGDIYIDYSDGQRVECYTVSANREMDLAVLKCETGNRVPLQLTGVPDAGTPAAAVGYPGGRGPITTTGEFTGERQEIRRTDAIRFTARIEPGSSGSPVVTPDGRVAAVATYGGGWGGVADELVPLLDVAENYPPTKEGAEWRLRLRRSALALAVALPLAAFAARRRGKLHPVRYTVGWGITAVLTTLAATQAQFMMSGPAHFV